MSETAVSYDFEQLEPSAPPPRDAAARLLAKAMADAEGVRERAREQGRAEGREAALAESRAELAAGRDALAEALAGIEALRTQLAEDVERDAIELALALAAKILAGALQARPELVIEVVQGALRRVSEHRRITVLVNAGDLDTVTAAIGELQSPASGVELCDLQADARVEPGGAIVRTADGEIDAGVQTQLERAREVVLAELGGEAQ